MAKLKLNRSFTYKAYMMNASDEIKFNQHEGEFMFKSDCHYYVEKFILDYINNNVATKSNEIKNSKFVIYKISTIEDNKIDDQLIESIIFDGEKIYIG